MVDVFYVEYKDESGQWQPLGVMTLREAIEWSWTHDHAAVSTLHIGDAARA